MLNCKRCIPNRIFPLVWKHIFYLQIATDNCNQIYLIIMYYIYHHFQSLHFFVWKYLSYLNIVILDSQSYSIFDRTSFVSLINLTCFDCYDPKSSYKFYMWQSLGDITTHLDGVQRYEKMHPFVFNWKVSSLETTHIIYNTSIYRDFAIDPKGLLYIHIYICVCVCVCECVWALYCCDYSMSCWCIRVIHLPILLRVKSPSRAPLIARFMGPTWGPSEADRIQVGPMWPNELRYLGHAMIEREIILKHVCQNERYLNITMQARGTIYQHVLISITAWIGNYIHFKV